MALTQREIKKFKAMSKQDILDYAVKLHKQLSDDCDADIIDCPLSQEAEKLHLYMFGMVPAAFFQQYVYHVCNEIGRPNWMAGRLGFSYKE